MQKSGYRNLFIIGNGFDRWQDLPTSYDEFRKYYMDHIDEALASLGISREEIAEADGTVRTVTPVELVYGDPFDPKKLPPEFFWSFETSLNRIDDQLLNFYYGRRKEGIRALKETVEQAQAILRELFSGWVRKLDVRPQSGGYRFGDDCFFINFNYTDTLEKRFGVKGKNIFHIHGDAKHPETILVGHATHPETAFQELIEHRFMKPLRPGDPLPRFEGLYAVEDALYRTDKHVADNIDRMCRAFLKAGLHIEDIENIYVLGHSFGAPDLEYFDYLDKTTRCGFDFDALSAAGRLDADMLMRIVSSGEAGEDELLALIQLNILYAIHHRERELGRAPVPFPKEEQQERELLGEEPRYDGRTAEAARQAVRQRFLYEQAGRTQEFLEKTAKEYGLKGVPDGCHSVLGLADFIDGGHERRKRNAQWHISFFTPQDKKQITDAMKRIGLKRYRLYPGIDGCIEKYRTC